MTVSSEDISTKDDHKMLIRQIKNSAPVFIIGSQRSGTTFLFRLIQQYLKIGFGRDNGHFVRLKKMLPYYGDLHDRDNLRRLLRDIVEIPEFKKKRFKGFDIDIDRFIDTLETSSYEDVVRTFYAEWAFQNGNIRWGGKTPDYTLHFEELHELFPDAKFIHIIRDGRDVALSLFQKKWGPKNSFMAAKYWKNRVTAARRYGRNLSSDTYMEMRYESLVQSPSNEFRRLIYFIDYEGDKEAIMRKFDSDIDQLLRKNNFQKWKTMMSKTQVRTFEMVSGDLLNELGYEVLYPEVLKKRITVFREAFYHADNALRKLMRGEGFRGLFEKLYRFGYDGWVKVSSIPKRKML